MKFFAPKNNWDMKSESSWWPMMGTTQTAAGVRISQDVALTYGAVFACTRIISETLASLPLNLMEQVDQRTTRKATGHSLYPLLHDLPNPEMDIVTFLDMQVALQLNWGNAYAEIERDGMGSVLALWPIHASRIPTRNIYRNSTDPRYIGDIVVGDPGEIVYEVNNDDGTKTAIPARDMLHVAGVLSRNGLTGQSIVMTGANVIGLAMATNEHASAIFKNGAVSQIALLSQKVVGKETADRLRTSWQNIYGGVKNHYKALLLEDGITPHELSMSPEASQLIEARGLADRNVAQLYRCPPHMIGDLSRATWANIESEEIAFVTHTMLPWIVRWEKAIYRQLLNPKEQKKYRAKFNVMGLLRGDSASRSQYYQIMFNLGAFSPNMILELEDMNPIDGGDQHFVPANNLVPLDKIGELAQANIDKLKAPPPQTVQAPSRDPGEAEDKFMERLERWKADHLAMLAVTLRDRDENVVKELTETVSGMLNTAMQRQLEAMPKLDVAPIVEAVGEVREAVENIKVPTPQQNAEAVAPAIESGLERAAEQHAQHVAGLEQARDTSESERLAAREAELKAAADEFSAKIHAERSVTHNVFALSLKREIDRLAEWEWKWLQKAIDKPLEWVPARQEFYGRFARHFVANLGEYEPAAAACGIVLDLKWGADRYSEASVRDLKSLDGAAADNHHDRLKETVGIYRNSQWTERAAQLAQDMIERGVKLFNEREQSNATGN